MILVLLLVAPIAGANSLLDCVPQMGTGTPVVNPDDLTYVYDLENLGSLKDRMCDISFGAIPSARYQ
jgi:hypothetical protein